jgi:hypothetical protein
MASYPTSKVHRVNRRKLGKGQSPYLTGISATLSASTVTLTITFATPVVVTGTIPVTVAGGPTFVSQTVVNATTVTQTWSATLVGHTVTLPAGAANVASYQGQKVLGVAATF